MKTKIVIMAILSCFIFNFAKAQESKSYSTAFGLRAGETSGFTIKQNFGSSHSLEGIIGLWNHGLSATLLFEKNVPTGITPGLNCYYGAGGHGSFYSRYRVYYYRNRPEYYSYGDVGLGIDGIIGLEYKIPKVPVAFSLDLKPFVEINTGGGAWMSLDPGLGIKVVL